MVNFEDGIYWVDVWNYDEFDIDYSDENDSCPFPPYLRGWHFVFNGQIDGPYTREEAEKRIKACPEYQYPELDWIP